MKKDKDGNVTLTENEAYRIYGCLLAGSDYAKEIAVDCNSSTARFDHQEIKKWAKRLESKVNV